MHHIVTNIVIDGLLPLVCLGDQADESWKVVFLRGLCLSNILPVDVGVVRKFARLLYACLGLPAEHFAEAVDQRRHFVVDNVVVVCSVNGVVVTVVNVNCWSDQ